MIESRSCPDFVERNEEGPRDVTYALMRRFHILQEIASGLVAKEAALKHEHLQLKERKAEIERQENVIEIFHVELGQQELELSTDRHNLEMREDELERQNVILVRRVKILLEREEQLRAREKELEERDRGLKRQRDSTDDDDGELDVSSIK
ncbi:hypothetical protein QAD02_011459 [Eretmocerus hayati]|uniref:Uncharacterized protein n=1 Tax=Eretmocerus hayati TaxID=131215 RepID=A0ACC2NXT4_9HYME|nr:hypothetical protein QAD02_011459 [Eretmocerus hayati]